MKVFEVELGGKTRRLRYEWSSARPFFKARGRKPFRFLFVDCLGFAVDDSGNILKDDNGVARPSADLVDDTARLELLVLGLGEDPKQVDAWVSKFIEDGGSLADLAATTVKAALYAGVTGKSVDLDEKKAQDEQAPEGKAPEA